MPSYRVFLLLGIIAIGSGLGTYYVTNLSTAYGIPKGATWIGIGPSGNMAPISTRMIVSVSIPHNWIVLEVSFNFTEFKKYHIWITMPYETLEANPCVIYQHFKYCNETSRIGNISANFRNFENKGSSVINATFIPNDEFLFLPSEPVTLSIEARVSKLVSIDYPLGSKQTVILTFFGDQTGVWDDAMAPYIGTQTVAMINYPFQVIVQFPKENYLSSDTFPTPIELFVTERFRSTIFDLNFSYPEGHAQSISCSYANPEKESHRSFWTFLSAVFLTTGITSLFESLRRKMKPPAEKPKEGKKERETRKGMEKKKDGKENEIRFPKIDRIRGPSRMSLKKRMEPLDRLFTLLFIFSPIVIGIFTSFGLDVRLLWVPMGALFFWALYVYQYRAVYQFSYNEELSLIERMRGLSFFFTFPILAIILAMFTFTSFGDNLVNMAILGIVGATCSFIIDLSIPRTFFGKETALFRKTEKTRLSDVLTATANVTIYFTWATLVIDRAVLEGTIVVVFATILITPIGFVAYRYEKKSRKLANELATSLRKTRWMEHYLGQKRREKRKQTERRKMDVPDMWRRDRKR